VGVRGVIGAVIDGLHRLERVEGGGSRNAYGRSLDDRDAASGIAGDIEAKLLLDGPHREGCGEAGVVLRVLLRAVETVQLEVDDAECS
jgi:hypothetical protein